MNSTDRSELQSNCSALKLQLDVNGRNSRGLSKSITQLSSGLHLATYYNDNPLTVVRHRLISSRSRRPATSKSQLSGWYWRTRRKHGPILHEEFVRELTELFGRCIWTVDSPSSIDSNSTIWNWRTVPSSSWCSACCFLLSAEQKFKVRDIVTLFNFT